MKRIAALALALTLALGLAACGGGAGTADSPAPNTGAAGPEREPVEVVVFAAASMEASLTKIAGLYQEVAPEVTLTFNFDSSGTSHQRDYD